MPRRVRRFGILLSVTMSATLPKFLLVCAALFDVAAAAVQAPVANPPVASAAAANQPNSAAQSTANSPAVSSVPASSTPVSTSPAVPHEGLNVVVIDPAHGGTDTGGRGTEGIRESDVVLELAAQLRKTLEAQGFQVMQTRDANDNPSFDDRSAMANAQRGAVFVTLHISSTGVTGTARVYVPPDYPMVADASGLIPWDHAQAPYVSLSRKLGDLVQSELAKRFKGSPTSAQVAPVRQLRTTAAPAIAVEISSVSVENRGILERMIPGVADAITRGVVAFRPSYVLSTISAAPTGVTHP
jgi:N-acetylmuramoyl-L-alanine amidase